jgi:hypothetical protein
VLFINCTGNGDFLFLCPTLTLLSFFSRIEPVPYAAAMQPTTSWRGPSRHPTQTSQWRHFLGAVLPPLLVPDCFWRAFFASPEFRRAFFVPPEFWRAFCPARQDARQLVAPQSALACFFTVSSLSAVVQYQVKPFLAPPSYYYLPFLYTCFYHSLDA